jgi:DNA-binding PadR family transcriptional regulator
MKSFARLGAIPAGEPLPAEEITELHAGRLLLLLRYCGVTARTDGTSRIDGLTKLAKLDFFVRYPDALRRVAEHLKKEAKPVEGTVESPMVRHHYGPWDKRYYQVLPFLEARRLITVQQQSDMIVFSLTEAGKSLAERLGALPAFAKTRQQMAEVKKLLGSKSGNALKTLIYEVFTEEVTERRLGDVIR